MKGIKHLLSPCSAAILLLCFALSGWSQTGYYQVIGGVPHLPVLSSTGSVGSPAAGMIIYSSADACPMVYTGSGWVDLCTAGSFTGNLGYFSVTGGIPVFPVKSSATGAQGEGSMYLVSGSSSLLQVYNGSAWQDVGNMSWNSAGASSASSMGAEFKAPVLAVAPAPAGLTTGAFYISSTDNSLYWYDGSAWQALVGNNHAPVASELAVSGSLFVGETLTATFTYADAENDPAGDHVYQWYQADDEAGTTNKTVIAGAASATYTLQEADIDKYIGFSVTPVATTGKNFGSTVTVTAFSGPVFPVPFITTWDITADSFTLPLYSSGTYDCTIDWGDGSTSEVTSYDDGDKTHTYATSGTYDITISGTFSSIYVNNSSTVATQLTAVKQWGDTGMDYFKNAFYGCSKLASLPDGSIPAAGTDFTSCFQGCSSLTAIPAGLFDYNTAATTFQACFRECSSLTSIPSGLFDNNTTATNFGYCFFGCSKIEAIPAGLFDYNTAATNICRCFQGCSKIEAIPAGLFAANTAVTDFSYCFYNCITLTAIPAGLFNANTAVKDFFYCFYGCSKIEAIPAGLFATNTAVRDFSNCFRSCSSLTDIPTGLFATNTAVTTFSYCFYGCIGLTTVPAGLFAANTAVRDFSNCFNVCTKLVLNAEIFCSPVDYSRFSGQTVNISNCFYRDSFSGVQGTAPDLWNYSFGSVTSTTCFGGSGNSCISLSNYASIPGEWGGPYSASTFITTWNITADSFTLPLYSSGTYDCTIDWGDGSTSEVTSYDDTDKTHTYASSGTYDISISGTFSSIYVNNSNTVATLLTAVKQWGDTGMDYFSYAFYGCSNLASLPDGSMPAAGTDFTYCFKGCSSLTAIPAGLFDHNTAATNFICCFSGCSSLTAIPTGLFAANTAATNFSACFNGCTKLALNAEIFCSPVNYSRFSGKSVIFTNCFYRTTFSGVQGTAPDLWNYSFDSVISTGCFGGSGNSATSLSNYASIPTGWK